MKNWWKFLAAIVILLPLSVLSLTVWYPADQSLANFEAPLLPADLDAYLQSEESAVHPKSDTEKHIQWASPDHRVTEFSLVFIHGFSATRQEIAPVVEDLAKEFHANAFLTRLHGHGLENAAMGRATAAEWIADANEALAIGRRLGHRVILIGCSTGASLILHLVQKNPPDVAAMVLISTNFRPSNEFSWLASGPLGGFIARGVIGENLSWQPLNPRQAFFWTHTYPVEAVHQMMNLVKYVDGLDLGRIHIPTLMLYTPKDIVVSTELIKEKFTELGSADKKLFAMPSEYHVLAGNIVSPRETALAEKEVRDFLSALPRATADSPGHDSK